MRRAVQGAHLLLIAVAAYTGALAARAAVAFWLEPTQVRHAIPHAQQSVQPKAPRARRQSEVAAIFRRNLFGSRPIEAAVAEPTSGAPLSLKLRGTAHVDGRDYAVFEDPAAGTQDVFSVGERVFDGPKLVSVDEQRAVLLYQGRRTTIELSNEEEGTEEPAAAGAAATSGGGIRKTGKDTYLVDRREVEHTIENLNTVVTQMRAIPYLRDGKSLGFRVFNIHPGSIFDRMGLRNGDVIQRVNGTELSSPANAMGLLDGISDAEEIRVELLRNNRPQVLSYRIQ